jgi:PAS domain S-box-containing protein
MKKKKSNPDPSPLRVLILEDNPADAELVERELRRGGIDFTSRLVEGKREFNRALADFQPQVILSDFKLPKFDGLAALETARLRAPDTPLIFVSGSIGEELAIEMLAQGASDYIFKDNLARLIPAVKRVIKETRLKLAKKKTDEELRAHVEELRILAEAADRFVQINDLDEMYEYLAQVIRDISGADYLWLSLYDEKLQAVKPKIVTGFKPFKEILRRRFHFDPMQVVLYLKDMRKDAFSDFVSRRLLPVRDGLYGLVNRKLPRQLCRAIEKLLDLGSMHSMGFSWENQLYGGLTVFIKKGNELKNHAQIETLLNQAAVSIKRLLAEQALRENEKKYRTLVTQSPDGIFVIDLQGNFLSVNQAMCSGLRYSEAEFLSLKIWDIVPEQYVDLHKKRLADILKGKAKNEAAEYLVRGKDGEIHYVDILSAPFYKDNELIGLQGIARDITEKKKMKIRLRESEEYYRTLVETSPDAVIIVDAGGRVTFASPKTFDLFGIPAQTTIEGISILDFVEPEEIPRVQGRMVDILSGRSFPEIREYRLLHHDRQPFWGEVSSAPLRDARKQGVGLLLVIRDVSERKRAEEARFEALARFSGFAEASQYGMGMADLDGRILFVNSTLSRMLGEKSAAECLGKHFPSAYYPPLMARKLLEEVMPALMREGHWHGELELLTADGHRVPTDENYFIIPDKKGRPHYIADILTDISERKRAEMIQQIQYRIANAVAKAETFFSLFETIRNELNALFDTTNFLVALYDEASGMLSAPFEKDEKELIPQWPAKKSLTGLVIREKRSMLLSKEQIRQMSQTGEIELIGSRAETWLGVPLLINEKILGAIVVQSYDQADAYDQKTINILETIASQASVYIERKQAETEILRQKAFLEKLVESAPEGIAITDCPGRMLQVNSEFVRMFGYKADEAVGKMIDDLLAPPGYQEEAGRLTRTSGAGEKIILETVRKRKDGTLFNVSIIGAPITIGEQQVAVYAIYRDISKRKQAEEQIRASLKEKEVLLQEIHHRVKNNLQIISGLLTLQAEQSAGKSLDDIFCASQDRIRSIALIHEKLYRSHNLAEIAFDEYLRALIANLFTSHGVAAGRITARHEMEPIFFTIEKAIPLGLIVNELVTNALKHAFPNGRRGEIRIGLHGYEGAKSYTQKTDSGTLHVIPTCELTVADDGVGLPDGFEPDTKKSLGMNLVSMLAKQIQAELKIKTGPGTEFRFLFPGLPAKEAIKNKEHGG